MKRALLFALVVPFILLSACDELVLDTDDDDDQEDQFAACTTEESLRPQLEGHLGETLSTFELVQVDGAELLADLREGQRVSIPVMNPDGELVSFEANGEPVSILSPQLEAFHSKGGDQEVSTTPARAPEIYRLDCEGAGSCGTLVFLDSNGSQIEGAIADDELGFTLIESASGLLTNIEGGQTSAEQGCQVLYNSDFHGGLNFYDYDVAASDVGVPSGADANEVAAQLSLDVTIPIVLDADQEFYDMNSATVWNRQASVIAFVNLIYALVEPFSSDEFRIRFEIDGQEAWLPGNGPTTTNRHDMTDEINDPGYYMINHPDNNEVSYFFVGYDMDGGIAGMAGGICNVPGYDDTFGSDETHQDNHAWGQQVEDVDGGYAFSTLFGRIIVAGHEIGHMLGARHSDGASSVCAGGSFSSMCGTSMMLSGASGGVAPDFRKPFFTDDNDGNIVECVGDVY